MQSKESHMLPRALVTGSMNDTCFLLLLALL